MIIFFDGQPGMQSGLTGVLGIQFGANLAANAALSTGYSGASFILRWQRRRRRGR